jgi:hypothetical protein
MPHHQNRSEFIGGQLANFFEQAALAETDIHLPHKRFRCISRADILHAWIQCNWRASAFPLKSHELSGINFGF